MLFRMLITLIALSVSCFIPPLSVHAGQEAQQVIVEVFGASCPFCAFGLEKRLGQIEGVAKVTMDLKGGKAIVTLQRGARIPEEAFRRAVDEAGFTPGKIIYQSTGPDDKAG